MCRTSNFEHKRMWKTLNFHEHETCAKVLNVPKFELCRNLNCEPFMNTEKWYMRWWVDKLVAGLIHLIHKKYTSKVNSCQDAKQELTECLLKSLCGQTLQLIYYWRDYLPKDELPQPLGLNLLRVPQDHQQITWLNSQTKMVLIQVWTCLRGNEPTEYRVQRIVQDKNFSQTLKLFLKNF